MKPVMKLKAALSLAARAISRTVKLRHALAFGGIVAWGCLYHEALP